MIKKLFLIYFIFFLIPFNNIYASGNYEAGKSKSQTCIACHGIDGNSTNKIYPKLAGQYKDYLVNTLLGYKSGKRKNAIMNGFAANLTEQDINDLALYFSMQKGLKVLPKK
ncbi:MAG: cytochrome C [Gammaproteobacteria bacterium]|nr:cytochrome C [Gammaproteobacteria bacterium]|tara:strand:+ start:4246 stop:4578 length:333 start_codon:yes stop_codon:yes gene_type:complete